MPSVKKLFGRDCELSNYIRVNGQLEGRPEDASRLILAALPGYPRSVHHSGTALESGRRFRPDALASVYLDQHHLEIDGCLAGNALDAGLQLHAKLAIVQRAVEAQNAQLPRGASLVVHANNSDGVTAWGNHLNFLTTAELFRGITGEKPAEVGFLASFICSSLIYTGSGMVGAGNGKEPCDFQIGQRPDFFTVLLDHSTMAPRRSFINMRDESHAAEGLARFHHITYDVCLSPVANVLQFGVMSLVLAMLESGWNEPRLIFDDPLGEYSAVSRDLRMTRPLRTAARGCSMTVVEHQRAVWEMAAEFVAAGLAENLVANAPQILRLWVETIDMAREGDLDALSRRTDWALKYRLIDRALRRRGLSWGSPEAKAMDLLFSNIDPRAGLFYLVARDGLVEQMPSEAEVEAAMNAVPDDSRAYLMSRMMREYGTQISGMDWSWIAFKVRDRRTPHWSQTARMRLDDPRRYGRAETEALLAACPTLIELVEAVNGDATSRHTDDAPRLESLSVNS